MVVMSLFFVSGACSLVYQVVWTRKLALLFGVTSHAVSTDKQAFGGPLWLLAGATALCGFCGLAAEVIYTRLLAIVFLGTTYAFTTMLTAFLCGIGLGGAFAALLQRRLHKKNAFPLAGVILGLAAISLLLSLPWLAGLPDRFMEMQRSSGLAWDATLRATFFLAFLTLFPFTFALGVSFPLIIGVGGLWRSSVGSLVGLMNSSNTLGGVAGAIAGGFFLLPLLGSQSSLLLLGSLLIVGALLLIVSAPAVKTTSKGVMALVLLLAFGATFTILPADVNQALNKGYMPQDHQVLYMKEGAEGTVAVSGPADALEGEDRVLWINRVQATTSIERGVKMNRLQGVLPLLFEKECDQVLFMCFGSGITCGTLALSPFERIDAVEISPEVLTVAPYFDKDNLGVLYNPAVSFHIDDGRNFLLRTDRKYDVITFEPMPLALAGVSTFYTSEYYTLCRKHLTPGGMVSQWIPLHSNDPELVRSLVSTFIAAFPEYCAFFVNADLFLLGAEEPLKMHYARAMERLQDPVLAEALVKSGLGDLSEIMSCFLFDKEALDRYAAGARIMGDDRPWAEFMAPRLVYARRVPEAVDTLLPFISNPLDQIVPESITVEERESLEKRHNSRLLDFPALKEYYGGSMLDDKAADAFVASLEVDPNNLNARYYLKTIVLAQGSRFLQWGEFERVVNLCDKALRFMPTDEELKELQKQAELQLNS
jgi:spermidine synthase